MVVERKDGWASSEDYEPYVGRWSRLVAREFVGWLDVLPNRQWLDVGRGTGALSDVVLERLTRPSNRYRSGWRLCLLCTPKSYRSTRDLSGHAPTIAGVSTPPALCGRGYAASVNAAAVERIFAEGKSVELPVHGSAQSSVKPLLCQDRVQASLCLVALSESSRRGIAMTRFAMDRFYEDVNSLFVRAYDAFYVGGAPIAGDVAFYERLARETGGPVLELACGTGRIALALAEKGLEITGVDISEGMLTVARRKAEGRPASVRDRLTLIHQDMSELNLGRRFGFVFVPARSFQHLLTIDLQRKSLEAIHPHLQPTGRLALHLFDPRLDLLIDANTTLPVLSGTHPETGLHYVGEVLRTNFDHVNQVRRDLWRYTEIGPNGEVLCEDTREMALRWTYRWELHHLLSLCGLAVEAEHSDFGGAAPAYGKELILVARVA